MDNPRGYEDYESRVEFYSAQGEKMCSADYSSEDATHGFGVAKAQWSRDGHYFVFSMQSTGGHQPWHSPTDFFSLDDHQLCHLDDFFNSSGISTPDFKLSGRNTVATTVDLVMRPVSASLDQLNKARTANNRKCVPCNAGKVYEFGDKTPYEHSPK